MRLLTSKFLHYQSNPVTAVCILTANGLARLLSVVTVPKCAVHGTTALGDFVFLIYLVLTEVWHQQIESTKTIHVSVLPHIYYTWHKLNLTVWSDSFYLLIHSLFFHSVAVKSPINNWWDAFGVLVSELLRCSFHYVTTSQPILFSQSWLVRGARQVSWAESE